MSEFARPFRITYPNGEVRHGVQFPDGICVTNGSSGLHGAVDLAELREHLCLPADAVVEWADGGEA